MQPVDAAQLYDLPEAGRRLLQDPARLLRLWRLGRLPIAWHEGRPHAPAAWVDAEAGMSGADPEGLARYWLERLAPPPREARRPLKDRRALPAGDLLDAGAAARLLFVDAARLARLDGEGTLPALCVDGETRYDARLVGLLADAGDGETLARRLDEVRAWTRFEYVSGLDEGARPAPARTKPAPAQAVAAAPGAWRMPEDLGAPGKVEEGEPSAPRPLIASEGYEVVEED